MNENDGTNEGLIHKTKPIMSVQFHPEANAGPMDTVFLFDVFLEHVRQTKEGNLNLRLCDLLSYCCGLQSLT